MMLAKRTLDVVVAAAVLVILSPVLLAIALWVRLDSPGPALFRHLRVGRGGVPLHVLKFRTMREVAGASALEITRADDVRISRAGRVLRRSKLDELPQLVNVLRGEMSLVGPRPEVERYVALYPEDARSEILSVPPGMTDLASIEFRHEQELLAAAFDAERTYVETILPRKVALYREYVRRQSLRNDARILAQTLRALFFPASSAGVRRR